MFKYLLVAIVILPALLAVFATDHKDVATARRTVGFQWFIFGVFWVALLYFLNYRWR